MANSPFISIENKDGFSLVDQFSGDVVFNSSKVGITKLNDYFLLYDTGAILVAGLDSNGDPLLGLVNMTDGQLAWTMDDKFDRIIEVSELENESLLLVTIFNIYNIDAGTGKVIWKSPTSKEAENINKLGGALGKFVKDAANKMTDQVDIKLDYYEHPNKPIFYIASEKEKEIGSRGSNPILSYTSHFLAYSLEDGSFIWDDPLEVSGQLSQVAFIDNDLLILPDDGNRTRINRFDYKTKEGKWGKRGRGITIKGGVYDYIMTPKGVVLVTRTNRNDFLTVLDTDLGETAFDKPEKIEGSLVGIIPTSNDLLYITTESVNILELKEGALKWKNSIPTRPSLTAEHEGKIYLFDFNDRRIKSIDMVTEQIEEVSSTSIDFDGKEVPRELEIMSDGIIVHSDQNIAKINFDDSLAFQSYFPAPREAGWKRALLYAEGIRATLIGAQSHYISGSLRKAQLDVASEDLQSAAMAGQLSEITADYGAKASDYARTAFSMANSRLNATTSGRDFMFVMSQENNDLFLIVVSKKTGGVEGKIALGKDREPNYAVDDVTGQVYYVDAKNNLISYKVE